MDKLILRDVITDIIKEADEAHKKCNEPFYEGEKLAFYKVLTSIQNALIGIYDDEIDDYGLNFDIDKRFLSNAPEIVPLSLE